MTDQERVYFAQIAHSSYGGWGTAPGLWTRRDDGVKQALRTARRSLGRTERDCRRDAQYVLEFPAGTTFSVSEIDGGWSSDKAPIALVFHRNLVKAGMTVAQLERLCRPEGA